MSLLTRYKGAHVSSLSLFKTVHESGRVSPIRKLFLSTRIPILEPLNIRNNNNCSSDQNKSADKNGENSNKPNGKKNNEQQKQIGAVDVPIADVDFPFMHQSHNKVHSNIVLKVVAPLPPFSSGANNNKFSSVFIEKVELCETMCDYEDLESDLEAKGVKQNELNELLGLGEDLGKLSNDDFKALLKMIEKHVYRPFSEIEGKYIFSDDLVVFTEQSWPHLSVVYQLLSLLLKLSPNRFDINHCKNLMSRFKTPDLNERNQLSALVILFIELNPTRIDQILKFVINIFIEYLNKNIVPYAMVPALAVFKVINEKSPEKVLEIYFTHFLPLLGAPHYVSFQSNFYQVLENIFSAPTNQKLAMPTLSIVLKHWPTTRSLKQVNFLSVLTLVLTYINPIEFKKVMKPVFKLYAKSTCSEHFKVSAASYPVWNKIQLEPMIMDNAKTLFPIVYTPVSKALREHWSPDVQEVLQAVMNSMNRIDSFVFQELCRSKASTNEDAHPGNEVIRKWATIARSAMMVDPQMNLAGKLAEIQRTFMKSKVSSMAPQASKAAINASTPNFNGKSARK